METMVSQIVTAPAVALRRADPADIQRLEELVHQAYRGGKAAVSWKNENDLVTGPRITKPELDVLIASANATILVAEVSESSQPTIVGCVMAELHDVEVHIGLLAVDPDRQNLGLGKKLIAAAEKYALNHFKCGALKMFVLSGRDELLAWYLKLGYSKTGETVPFCVSAMGTRPVCNDAHFIAIAKTIP